MSSAGLTVAPLPFDRYGEGIGDAASVLRNNAHAAGMAALVPTCPDWTVFDLVTHQGVVHRWATAVLRSGERDARAAFALTDETGWTRAARAAADVLDWFDDGMVDLLNALVATPEDAERFFFLADAPPARLAWARRQCHETTVHAVDAMAARLRRPPTAAETWIRPSLAADGIDELLTGFVPRRSGRLRAERPVRVVVRAVDTGHAWQLDVGGDPVAVTRLGDGTDGMADATMPDVRVPDVRVTGDAVGLYLGLWNRGAEYTVEASEGFGGWFERTWPDATAVRWS